MTKEKSIRLGFTSAIASFVIGSIIFGLYYFTSNSDILFLGYGFILLAGIINTILFINIVSAFSKSKDKKLTFVSIFILLNIPIMLFY